MYIELGKVKSWDARRIDSFHGFALEDCVMFSFNLYVVIHVHLFLKKLKAKLAIRET